MNASALTRHLLIKDLRYQRGWLALFWLFALALPFIPHPQRAEFDHKITIATTGFLLLGVFVLVRLIHLDAPGRNFRFLATKPVSWRTLPGSKMIFAFACLLVPVWIAKLGVIGLAGIRVNRVDVASLLLENSVQVGAIIAAVALFAIFIRSTAGVFAAMCASAVLVFFGEAFFTERARDVQFMPEPVDVTLSDSRRLVFCLGVIVTAGLVTLFRYRQKALLKPLCALAAGLAVSLAGANYWPYNLSTLFPDKPQGAAELSAAMRDQIKLTLTGKAGQSETNGGSGNGGKSVAIEHQFKLVGVDPPYFAVLVDYHAEAALKSGQVIRSKYGHTGTTGGMSEAFLQRMAGFTPQPQDLRPDVFEVFNYQPNQHENQDLSGAIIKGLLTVEIRKAIILKTLKLENGAALDVPRMHYVIRNVGVRNNAMAFQLITSSTPALLRGDYAGGENVPEWLVFNRAKGECLAHGGGMWNTQKGFFLDYKMEEMNPQPEVTGDYSKDRNKSLSEDWVDAAEISFFGSEPCGKISFPYEVKNVDLQY